MRCKATGLLCLGIVEPVRAGMEAGLRLGLGKAEQDTFYVSAENVTRKRLETEVQADEDYERTLKREVIIQSDQKHACTRA
jgi:hypothetical protein